MTETKKGWDIPPDFSEQYNLNSFLTTFPPEGRLQAVQGVLLNKSKYHPDELVSLQALDAKGELLRLWVDVPNAMYLMNMLLQVQRNTGAAVPIEQPPPTKPHKV